ncbi:uncharacterized protein LOC128662547 [Bombina bombina]|uniref:uncharacterized protein LOC128662547 n=1 Tax=Bombina bombina TaxID=8345 RepID=UPI00235B2C68|nr:uncharacterized protein LOC128662547 [Bombina bombina]
MEKGFVATSYSSSSPSQPEQWDPCSHRMHGGSSFVIKVSESTPQGLEVLPGLSRSPLPPDAPVFELSSLASENPNFFNNSVVGVFYGTKVSTPYKENNEEETPVSMAVEVTLSKLQDSDIVVSDVSVQKPTSPMWEISEITSAMDENTPSLDVNISDLRYLSSSEHEPVPPAQSYSAAYCAQWVGAKHKDIGMSYLQPFRYQRQLSASEIPVSSKPAVHSIHLSNLSPDGTVERSAF